MKKILPDDCSFFDQSRMSELYFGQSSTVPLLIDQMIQLIVDLQDTEYATILLKWMQEFHADKSYKNENLVLSTVKAICILPRATINKIKFPDNIQLKSNQLIFRGQTKIYEFKLLEKGYLNTEHTDRSSGYSLLLKNTQYFYLSLIYNDFDNKELIKQNLTKIINSFELYYKFIKEAKNPDIIKDFFVIVIKTLNCTKSEFRSKFTEEHKLILNEVKNFPETVIGYADLLTNLYKLEEAKKLLSSESAKDLDKSILYSIIAEKYITSDKYDEALFYYIESFDEFNKNLSKYAGGELEHLKTYYYEVLSFIISISNETGKEIKYILDAVEEGENKKFLLFFNDYYKNYTPTELRKKFTNIDQSKIHPFFEDLYNYLEIDIKYSEIQKDTIVEEKFLNDLGGLNSTKLTPNQIIELCKKFDQKNLGKKYINQFKAEDFFVISRYIECKYIFQKYSGEIIVDEINSFISDDNIKANIYYNLAIYYRKEDLQLSLFLVNQINKLNPENLNKNTYNNFLELKSLIEAYKILEEKKNVESKFLGDNTQNTNELNDELDYSGMSSQEIYIIQEELRIRKQIKTLEEKQKIDNKNLFNITHKANIFWQYKNNIIDKSKCKKLYQKVGNKWKKYYAIIDPKVEKKIKDIEPFQRALDKGDLGCHKQNGVMIDHNKIYKITADTDVRVFCNKYYTFIINGKKYNFIPFDDYGNHERYNEFYKTSPSAITEIPVAPKEMTINGETSSVIDIP